MLPGRWLQVSEDVEVHLNSPQSPKEEELLSCCFCDDVGQHLLDVNLQEPEAVAADGFCSSCWELLSPQISSFEFLSNPLMWFVQGVSSSSYFH